MYTFCYKVLSPRRQIPNRLSVFSVFNCRYSVFFGIVNRRRCRYQYFKISDIGSVFRYTDPRLAGAIRRAKLQSNCHHQQTNTQLLFTGRMPFLSPNQQRQSTDGETAAHQSSRKTRMHTLYAVMHCSAVSAAARSRSNDA